METRSKFNVLFRNKFVASYLYFLFLLVLLSSIFSAYLNYTNVTQPIKSEIRTGEIPIAINQTLVFLVAVIISTMIILFLLIRRKFFQVKLLYTTAFSLASFLFLSLFLEPLRNNIAKLNEVIAFQITLLLNFFITVLIVYGIFHSANQAMRNHSILLITCIMGSILGEVLTLQQLVIFLVFFAIYDIIAVFFGPLKRIAKEIEGFNYSLGDYGKEDLVRAMFLNLTHVEIGIGDLLLYSAMVANLSLLGISSLIYSILGIIIGSFITIALAKKFKIFPGLPIPIFLTLLLLFLF